MKILYIGCVQSSYKELKLLIDNHKDVVGVITKERSKFNSDFCDISDLAIQNNIPYLYVNNINDENGVSFIKKQNPDVIYCFGWSQLIKSEILEIPKLGVIGTHPAELPHNRGRHPIIWALVLGLEKTAASFFRMDEKADTGDIISQEIVPVYYDDYAIDLYNRIEDVECKLILKFTEELESGTNKPIIQHSGEGNSWRKRSRIDGLIDWRMSSRAIYNLVRALSRPYPGAEFIFNDEYVTVWRVEEILTDEYKNIEPGKVIKFINEHDFYVKAYDNVIHVIDCSNNTLKEGDYL